MRTMRCEETLNFLPFSADHLWKSGPEGDWPVGGCVGCGLTTAEWRRAYEDRLEELGQVGVPVLRVVELEENDYLAIDVKA